MNTSRKYTVNEHAFDLLTSEAMYWLGFLFADGCISDGVLRLVLAIKDKEHIAKLASFLESTHPIREIPWVGSLSDTPKSSPRGLLQEYVLQVAATGNEA